MIFARDSLIGCCHVARGIYGVAAVVKVNVKKLAEQLDAAQAILDEMRITIGRGSFDTSKNSASNRVKAASQIALRASRERQKRTNYVGNHEIFGEPAWDILLDLFIRQTKDEKISLRAANSNAPASTAVRWLRILEQNGLISLQIDEADDERLVFYLTAAGYDGMLRYLESIAK